MTSTYVATEAQDEDRKPAPMSDRSRAENRLGLKLVAPAVVMMLLVTAYPMLRALYLSLFQYRVTAPDDRAFVGLNNYVTVLTDQLWWRDIWNTVIIMVVTVAIELVIGFAFAMVMHRIIFARGVIRTAILIPYGIITVVSAFAWQFAFSLNNGFVNGWLGWLPGIDADFNWFGSHWPAMFAIMVAVLFRALDAFRIFDNIFVMTRGAQDTESASFLTYRQVIENLELGIGSALSVLLFLCVLLIAFLLVRLFKVDLAAARGEG